LRLAFEAIGERRITPLARLSLKKPVLSLFYTMARRR